MEKNKLTQTALEELIENITPSITDLPNRDIEISIVDQLDGLIQEAYEKNIGEDIEIIFFNQEEKIKNIEEDGKE